MATDLRQTHFRFGKDDGTESGHTFWQSEDTNHTQLVDSDWTFLLRFTEQEVGNTAAANTDAYFQYNKNSAGWVDITTSTSVVKAVAVGAFANGDHCTKRLSGTGTFETSGAGCTEDGTSGGNVNDIAALGNSETEAGLQVVAADVSNGDTIQFRFRSPDWTITYTVTPTLTIQKSVIEYGTATMSGAGTVAAAGRRTRKGISSLAGTGLLAGIAGRIRQTAATIAGVGALACIGTVIPGTVYEYGSATLSGTGDLSAAGTRQRSATVAISGTGSLSGVSTRLRNGQVALSGTGDLTVGGVRIRGGKVTLTGQGEITANGCRLRVGAATLEGTGSLSASGTVLNVVLGSATLSGVGTLSAKGDIVGIETGKVSFIGSGSLAVLGRILYIPIIVLELECPT